VVEEPAHVLDALPDVAPELGRSRIVSVRVCGMCGEHDRESVQLRAESDCKSHPICRRPY
jgi:hypothetical protein